ncbi:MAG: DUF503 domain-containing protein [Candidatus Atribacteria bacterium]|nr:DUF503 domain-containing protein [Candidatus Atribacteria bacterium]
MRVGVCQVELFINGSLSLKDKRRVMNSVKQKLRNRFNISIVEIPVDAQWKRGDLGISCVGLDERSVRSTIDQIVRFIEDDDRVEVSNLTVDIL